MSRGSGQLQRAILAFMQQHALHQRTPQREHWRIESLVLNVARRDPAFVWVMPMTSRQLADARKRIRRACDGLAATGKLVKVGIGWTLPPETPPEAMVRRKRFRISERLEQKQERRDAPSARPHARTSIDRSTRGKLVEVLGQLGSDNPNIVITAARQAERLRLELGRSWGELVA